MVHFLYCFEKPHDRPPYGGVTGGRVRRQSSDGYYWVQLNGSYVCRDTGAILSVASK